MTRVLRGPSILPALGLLAPSLLGAGLLVPLRAAAAPEPAPPLASAALPEGRGNLRVEPDGSLVLGTERIAPATQPRPSAASLTVVPQGPGSWLVEARLRAGKGGHVEALRLRSGQPPELLFDEPFGPTADGELSRELRIDARGIERWQGTPAVARCDGAQPLFSERYDLEARSWRPVAAEVPSAPALSAGPALTLPPPRRALRFSATSRDGTSDRADRLGAPRELDDGRDQSALIFGGGAVARGAFVTARAPGSVELVAIRIAPPPAPARLPEAAVLIAGNPARPIARLVLGAGTASRWFTLAARPKGACVSLVADEPERGEAIIGFGEISLHAADDAPEGLSELAAKVGGDAEEAEAAARVLERDPGAVRAVLGALATASTTGRRRLLVVLRAHEARLGPGELPELVRQLGLARGEERPILVELLRSLGDPAARALAPLLGDATQTLELKADVLRVLAPTVARSKEARDRVFTALDDPQLRSAARAALVSATERDQAIGVVAAEFFHDPRLPAGLRRTRIIDEVPQRAPVIADAVAVVGAALPRATDPAARTRMLAAVTDLLPLASLPSFELQVRTISALSRSGDAALPKAVGAALAQVKDPALRLVAVDALPPATDPTARMIYTSALGDGDARVRERALDRLLAVPGAVTTPSLVTRADDAWPQLRRLAYAGLGASCEREPMVGAFLDRRVFGKGRGVEAADRDPRARAAALLALARCPGTTPEAIAAAIQPKQPAEVREQAAATLARGGARAIPVITRSLDRVFNRGGAELPDTAVALLRALGRAGEGRGEVPFDDATLVLLRDAAADPFYPSVRMAALEALSRACPAGSHAVFDRADKDPENAVQRAAALGRARCLR